MRRPLAILVLALGVVAGCEGGRGGGGGHSNFGGGGGGGGGHGGWGGASSSASVASSSHGSSSSGSSRPSLSSSSSSSRSHESGGSSKSNSDGNYGFGRAVANVLPVVAEALIVGQGDYTVDDDAEADQQDPSVTPVDPCLECPLEDACGVCIGYGHAACRDNTSGMMSRCESSVAPTMRRH